MARGIGDWFHSNIAYFLEGIHFPCSKGDLINHATSKSAPDDVLEALRSMPDSTFSSMMDVMSGVGEVE